MPTERGCVCEGLCLRGAALRRLRLHVDAIGLDDEAAVMAMEIEWGVGSVGGQCCDEVTHGIGAEDVLLVVLRSHDPGHVILHACRYARVGTLYAQTAGRERDAHALHGEAVAAYRGDAYG